MQVYRQGDVSIIAVKGLPKKTKRWTKDVEILAETYAFNLGRKGP